MTMDFENAVVLVEPASPERVRANCYFLGRLAYAYLKHKLNHENPDTEIIYINDATVKTLCESLDLHGNTCSYDSCKKKPCGASGECHLKYIIHVWSETQIPMALTLRAILQQYNPFTKITFIGFNPLLERYGLPKEFPDYTEVLQEGMLYQYEYAIPIVRELGETDRNERFLTTIPEIEDCDCHYTLVAYLAGHPSDSLSKGKPTDVLVGSILEEPFYPMLTSVGCPMGCKFCKVSAYQRKPVSMDFEDVSHLLNDLNRTRAIKTCMGGVNIHLFDDNFLADTDRAIDILLEAYRINPRFRFIFLATLRSTKEFVDKVDKMEYRDKWAIYSVIHMVEIGLETVNSDMSREIGKDKPKQDIDPVSVMGRFNILWLTITFLPNENIQTLNEVGEFLSRNGLNPEFLTPRMKGAGTQFGLGQFFCPYEGTDMNNGDDMRIDGLTLLETPLRLLPSWIPFTFLESDFMLNRSSFHSKFLAVNKDGEVAIPDIVKSAAVNYGIEVPEYFNTLKFDTKYNVRELYVEKTGDEEHSYLPFVSHCVTVAILARLNIIQPYAE